jgi:hypothetical protein
MAMENFRHNQLVFEPEDLCMVVSKDWIHEQTYDDAHIKHMWWKSARKGNKKEDATQE